MDNANNKVLDLIKYVVSAFAEFKDEAEYSVNETDAAFEVTVSLVPSDMGKVIGRQGKIAKALRTLVGSATPRESKRYLVEIREKA